MCIFSQVQVEFVPFRFETEQLTQDPCMWLKKDAKQKCKMPFCQFWKWMNAKVSAKASASAEFHWAPKAISQQADKLMSLKTTRGGAIFQVMIHNLKKNNHFHAENLTWDETFIFSKHIKTQVTSQVRKHAFMCTNLMMKTPVTVSLLLIFFSCCGYVSQSHLKPCPHVHQYCQKHLFPIGFSLSSTTKQIFRSL